MVTTSGPARSTGTLRRSLGTPAAAGLFAAAMTLAACTDPGAIEMDGLPISNLDQHVTDVDALWQEHRATNPLPSTVTENSECFYLLYENVVLNSMLCGPVYWLGDPNPTWDYYPLSTLLSPDGLSLTAIIRGDFAHDYPISSADTLYRPDGDRPANSDDLEEPAAPVASTSAVALDDLPPDFRITRDLTITNPPVIATGWADGAGSHIECSRVGRLVWTDHIGSGEHTMAPPEGSQFLILIPETSCDLPAISTPDAAANPPADGAQAGTATPPTWTITIEGQSFDASGWCDLTAYVVPSDEADSIRLSSSLFDQTVWVDLITGEMDSYTQSLNPTEGG